MSVKKTLDELVPLREQPKQHLLNNKYDSIGSKTTFNSIFIPTVCLFNRQIFINYRLCTYQVDPVYQRNKTDGFVKKL